MERDLVLNGIRLGEYEITPQTALKKLQDECITHGMNYAEFCGANTDFGKAFYEELAKKAVEHGIYLHFGYHHLAQQSAQGFDDETAQALSDILGNYLLSFGAGGEHGTKFGCGSSGYTVIRGHGLPNHTHDLKEAKENFDAYCKEIYNQASRGGKYPITETEPTQLLSYAAYAGLTFPTLETCNGNPEIMIPLVRATARAMGKDFWATYIAHEWYAGTKTLDPLKMNRLKLIYDYAYMSGSNMFVLESGDELLYAHDTDLSKAAGGAIAPKDTPYGYDHPICQQYRQTLRDFAKFVQEDFRPKGGPKVKVAFVQGNLDGYSHWRAGSSLWHVFDDPDFGYSAPEYVWRIFDDLGVKRRWWDVHNFGPKDLSAAPAYGTYDIVPAWAGYEAFSRYEYLIFTGWNTMTEEIYEDLRKFVCNGGKLLISAAHLNTSTKRNGEINLIHNGKVSELFGCDLDIQNKIWNNYGVKFLESIVPGVQYPASFQYDPLFSEGYANYAKASLITAQPSACLANGYSNQKDPYAMDIAIAENHYGKGYTILMTTLDYPSGAPYPVYRNVVRELLTASHRQADIKVCGGDRLRFTVYEGNKIYLLNTDMECRTEAFIECNGQTHCITLNPMEFRPMQL